ncbi:MAG: MEDS domain-containing protein [Nitrososphaera sp.]
MPYEPLMERIHSLCLIEGSEDTGYPALYDIVSKYASRNYAVIYAVENDVAETVRHMSRRIDVETLVESGALTIVDRNVMYSVEKTNNLEGQAILDSWHSLMLKVKKRSNSDGILAIGSAETFFEHHVDPCKLVNYETIVGKKFHIPLEAICCYSANAFSRLSFGDLVAILNAHHSTIHTNNRYREWHPSKFIELARSGLDRALGHELSDLIFKTMKLCYRINDSHIISRPQILEDMLERIMGKKAADATMRYVKDEVRKSVAFS